MYQSALGLIYRIPYWEKTMYTACLILEMTKAAKRCFCHFISLFDSIID